MVSSATSLLAAAARVCLAAAAEPPATLPPPVPAPAPKVAIAPPVVDRWVLPLTLPATSEVRTQPLLDPTVALVEVTRPPADIERQVMAFTDLRAFAVAGPQGQAGIFVVTPHPILEMRQRRQGGEVLVELQTAHVAQSLKQRVREGLPAPDVAREDARLLADAETLLGGDSMVAARRSLTPLLSHYTIQPWVQLRLADVAFLEDGPLAACGLYDDVADRFADRNAGVIAALRMFALKCPQEHTPLVWTTLLKRTNTDDPTGRWLAEQARWALQYTESVPQLLAALRWGERTLGTPLWQRLIARLVHGGTPLQVAEAGRAWAKAIDHHPDAAGLHLFIAHALCVLELPSQARRVPAPLLEPWAASLRACRPLAPPGKIAAHAQVEVLRRGLRSLEQRLDAAERAVQVLTKEKS